MVLDELAARAGIRLSAGKGARSRALAGEGDVVPEPLAQGSGESMDSAEKSAQND